jgi:hypothetical protein
MINNTTLEKTTNTTYVGLYYKDNLTWDLHLKKLCCKLLYLNTYTKHLNNMLLMDTKLMWYYAFIHSNIISFIEYYYKDKNIWITKLNNFHIRIIMNLFYNEIMFFKKYLKTKNKSNKKSELITKQQTLEFMKYNKLFTIDQIDFCSICTTTFKLKLKSLLIEKPRNIMTDRILRSYNKATVPFCRTTMGQNIQNYKYAASYNTLPLYIRNIANLDMFKKKLKDFLSLYPP